MFDQNQNQAEQPVPTRVRMGGVCLGSGSSINTNHKQWRANACRVGPSLSQEDNDVSNLTLNNIASVYFRIPCNSAGHPITTAKGSATVLVGSKFDLLAASGWTVVPGNKATGTRATVKEPSAAAIHAQKERGLPVVVAVDSCSNHSLRSVLKSDPANYPGRNYVRIVSGTALTVMGIDVSAMLKVNLSDGGFPTLSWGPLFEDKTVRSLHNKVGDALRAKRTPSHIRRHGDHAEGDLEWALDCLADAQYYITEAWGSLTALQREDVATFVDLFSSYGLTIVEIDEKTEKAAAAK